jgi:hypothetical protein
MGKKNGFAFTPLFVSSLLVLQKHVGPCGKLCFLEVLINLDHHTSPIIITQGS